MLDWFRRTAWASEGPVVIGVTERLSRADLRARVRERAEELSRSAGPGSSGTVRCLEVAPDVPGLVELLATWTAGLVPAPLTPGLSVSARTAARDALSGAVLPPDAAVVLWTSGTSGTPRGVAISWKNLEASAAGARQRLGLGRADVWLASLSPAHVGGLALLTRAAFLGSRLIMNGRFDVERAIGVLDSQDGPTHVSLVPTQLHQLMDRWGERDAPACLRCVLIGGAHAPIGLVERAVGTGWPVALTYGATEMTSQIATSSPSEVASGRRDVGRVLPDVEVLIADDGEILARGPTRAVAYVGQTSADLADADGWYHTGDLGALDSDQRLTITGRRIDRIVSGGVTLDAVGIEEALRRHPAVIDVCVVGTPDEVWGERVAAWVEPVEGEFDLDEFERWVSEEMESSRRPRLWRVAGGLPRNANGKVDRAAVRAAF